MTIICLAEPGCFRGLHSFVQGAAGGGGRLEVRFRTCMLSFSAMSAAPFRS